MSTKYYCDKCGKEEGLQARLREVTIDYRDGKMKVHCDLCPAWQEKMFKGVKEYHATVETETAVS